MTTGTSSQPAGDRSDDPVVLETGSSSHAATAEQACAAQIVLPEDDPPDELDGEYEPL
jgi:hypothetical protein